MNTHSSVGVSAPPNKAPDKHLHSFYLLDLCRYSHQCTSNEELRVATINIQHVRALTFASAHCVGADYPDQYEYMELCIRKHYK